MLYFDTHTDRDKNLSKTVKHNRKVTTQDMLQEKTQTIYFATSLKMMKITLQMRMNFSYTEKHLVHNLLHSEIASKSHE